MRRKIILSSMLVVLMLITSRPQMAQEPKSVQIPTTTLQIVPHIVTGAEPIEPSLTENQRGQLLERLIALRERVAAQTPNPPSPRALEPVPGPETNVEDTPPVILDELAPQFHGSPSAFVIGRNNSFPLTPSSTVAEPAAGNDGPAVFYTANWTRGHSTDGGVTWTSETIPAGPSDAPLFCCDQDVLHDQSRGVTFWIGFYLNSAMTKGVVRIFVRQTIPAGNACFYDIRTGPTGSTTVPDYPHFGHTNDYLYLTTNNITSGSWSGAQISRFNIDQMADCVTAGSSTFNWVGSVGQRVLVPVRGTRDIMYLGSNENATTFRIFSWPDSSSTVSTLTRSVASSTFGTPDCRGGVNNVNWYGAPLEATIHGFRIRGAVGRSGGSGYVAWYWNVANDSGHPNAYIRSAVFTEQGFTLIKQPDISSSSGCYGFPDVNANARGDFGISLAFGGKNGGGGPAAQGYAGIADEFTSGIGSFGTVFLTAAGTYNVLRFGDYYTVGIHEPCDLAYEATSYAMNGGADSSHVNRRYIEFVRGRDSECYRSRRNSSRIFP